MLLALDTATRTLSLALHNSQRVVAEHTWHTANNHSVELAPAIAQMLQRAGLEPRQLSGLAVALGPGTYTGLRIGLALAKGLALAHGLPLIGVPTFDILLRAQAPRAESLLAVFPAGRGRVSAAAYRWDAGPARWAAVGPTRLSDWATLIAAIAAPTYVCGEIDEAGRAHLLPHAALLTVAPPAEAVRRAGYLAELGWERLRAGQTDSPATLAPIYGGTL